ncbi:MAG: T9SS type A sorting domain-containing protein [Flavobacterium sp.]|uniref:carboxypeptidase-like regulatory domain-containing protein n=1 Tax=Flavobacterium sp. TaxID=239 RepID=UPI00121F0AA7|nr:carboxypeptidase-like regulatory domain-containing protein [Flavobacterium sp.]RZJ67839.1 MAG: T9SS type A sorting domain-containing protein [Flavobacterium sp.]
MALNFRNLLSIAALLLSFLGSAQTLTGTVTDDEKKPFPKVEVLNLSNYFVTYSDNKGKFTIKGNVGDQLKFSAASSPDVQITAKSSNKVSVKNVAKIREKQKKRLAKNSRRTKPVITHSKKKNPYNQAVIGQITDASGALPDVSVWISETGAITTTDANGYFGLNAEMGQTLVARPVGMKEGRVQITHAIMNIKLQEIAGLRDAEVTVISIPDKLSDDKSYEGYFMTGKAKFKTVNEITTTTIRSDDVPYRDGDKSSEYSSTINPVGEGLKEVIVEESVEKMVSGVSFLEDVAPAEGPATESVTVEYDQVKQKASQLTAGEVNDFSKFEYWTDIASEVLAEQQSIWKMRPKYRYSVIAINEKSSPIVGNTFALIDESGNKIWVAKTDNTGRAELWFNPTDSIAPPKKLTITDENGKIVVADAIEFRVGINTVKLKADCISKPIVDVAFMVDATGSMGDEIKYLQAEVGDVIKRTRDQLGNADVSLASVFYRDNGDDYLVKAFDFSTDINSVKEFIDNQEADGGGDYPEAVTDALETSINALSWNPDATSKLLFVLLDAPAHEDEKSIAKLQHLSRIAAEKGIRVVSVSASGIDKSAEYLMRSIALQTNGTYLFITNHSGIGNDHIEPTTDDYSVEMLNDLILRVIVQFSQISGCDAKTAATNPMTEKQLKDFKWSYFPNPAKDVVTIRLEEAADGIQLFDINGKLVFSQSQKASEYQLDLSGIPNAIYYLKVSVGEKILTGKIVKR